ncbi:hypothetical protein COU61_04560 [Candidatus Pacearchaeota archaeon CG10_big_fil_rev_8_21_14_0_10_35_13]|nr:MAG: hypothetical protein COU61_04560 [Candidatus Pacearchaeota archaeon CG10_big_fil_rev_8_21_14_0_10_35_13]
MVWLIHVRDLDLDCTDKIYGLKGTIDNMGDEEAEGIRDEYTELAKTSRGLGNYRENVVEQLSERKSTPKSFCEGCETFACGKGRQVRYSGRGWCNYSKTFGKYPTSREVDEEGRLVIKLKKG